ncbi:hypothetical protein D3C85_1154590 [compost metagenome]
MVRCIAIIAARDLEFGDFEGLLFLEPHTTLRQLKYLGLTDIDLQAVIEQLALDALLVLAALGHMVGATAEKQGAAQCGAPER